MLARIERAKAFRRWVLDVLDHVAEPQPEPQLPALPDKTADTAFENELKRAINQRAHSLSIRQFDEIREKLRRAVKKCGQGKTIEGILSMIRGIEVTDSGYYILRRGDFRGMTSRCAASFIMLEGVMDSIHKLEAETGAELYGRYDPRGRRTCPPPAGGPLWRVASSTSLPAGALHRRWPHQGHVGALAVYTASRWGRARATLSRWRR